LAARERRRNAPERDDSAIFDGTMIWRASVSARPPLWAWLSG
jgi:hypothetical protein